MPRELGAERRGAESRLVPAGLMPWAPGGLSGHGTVRGLQRVPPRRNVPRCPSREGPPPPHAACDGACDGPALARGDSLGTRRALQPEEMKRKCVLPPPSGAFPGLRF